MMKDNVVAGYFRSRCAYLPSRRWLTRIGWQLVFKFGRGGKNKQIDKGRNAAQAEK